MAAKLAPRCSALLQVNVAGWLAAAVAAVAAAVANGGARVTVNHFEGTAQRKIPQLLAAARVERSGGYANARTVRVPLKAVYYAR